ncbi:hypothetical protein MFRU_035g00280 [Monilinia fructicola]|uniref:Uncharacterized protein n=1 Tax=Monilinia fructicola TaxID=38448 RepID=A0A5M9JVH1_MONFR|nr:hypothetical protein EYC84_001751 [Monilinia fructicola]KAG4026876.1 hypothetical protein MFRU_035g00280 [Monilinia fructicola]
MVDLHSEQSENSNINIYKDLESYPWSTDNEFQGGLSAILGNASSPDQIRELTLRAQCFYLSRKKNVVIDFDGYKAYLTTQSSDPPSTITAFPLNTTPPSNAPLHHENDLPPASTTTDQKTAPYPPSFAEIVAMIQAGVPIPGIRDIPDTVLTDQGTKPVARKRRKPWEKDVDEETIQGGGTFGDHRDIIIQQEYPTDV